jgi:hypothetical protein
VGHNDEFKIHRRGINGRTRPGIPPNGSDLHGQTGVNAVEAELTMRLASTARVREAARARLVDLLHQVDSRTYTALLHERGLLALLGSRAIEPAPGAADDVLRSRVEAARRETRLRALMLDATLRTLWAAARDRHHGMVGPAGRPAPTRRTRRHRRAQPGVAAIDRRGAGVSPALRRRLREPHLVGAAADRSTRREVALADPFIADENADVFAAVMLIDALLSMGREKLGFLRRYYCQPLPYVPSTYGLPEAPTAVVAGRNALHAVGTLVKKSPRMIRAAARSPQRPTLIDALPTPCASGDPRVGRSARAWPRTRDRY